MMSGTNSLESAAAEMMLCCACCGISEGDDIKLKTCTACKSARYCSVECQKQHRPQHKRACKKRAAELRDELLFKQPESTHHGDCPICCLPMPIGGKYSSMMACCSKIICNGCVHANQRRELEGNLQQRCPFCRHPTLKTDKEYEMQIMKRVEANDPFATFQIAIRRHDKGNYEEAIKYYTKAVELGNVDAHYLLSTMYQGGPVVEKDEKKEVYHLERAAIGGHPDARHNLGCTEAENGKFERAVKHMIIAASLGYDTSIQVLKECYADGKINKEDFAAALRAYQAAVDATKSPQREAAAKAEATGG
eukprot:scaffold3316_cov94-Skeletonema_marinoi.AAC.22